MTIIGRLRAVFRRRRVRMVAGGLAAVALAGIIIPLFMATEVASAAWWSPSWSYRRQITFANSASADNLANFPVRVSLVGGTNIDYTKTQDAGQDIRFTDPNGALLAHEIERWDETGGTAVSEIWVKVPQIDAGSNTDYIYMYYGNANAADGQKRTQVWESNFKSVWHLANNAASTTVSDATANAFNGTHSVNTSTATTTGKVYNGFNYVSGSTHNTNVSTVASSISTGDISYSAWVNFTSTHGNGSARENVVALGTSSSNNDAQLKFDTDGKLKALVCPDSSCALLTGAASTQTSWTSGTWYFVSASFSTTNGVKLYVNGSSVATNATTYRGPTVATVMLLGGRNGFTEYLGGKLDEVRVAATERSVSWFNAEYLSGSNTFNTIGSESSGTYNPEGTWLYRRKVTFNNVPSGSTLSDFPVRIALSAARGNITYANTQDNGEDIRFVDDDDSTQLPHQIEHWDETGVSDVWTRAPTLTAGKQTDYIWMYYGNASVTDGQSASSVWTGASTGSMKGTWHLNQDPSTAGTGGISDSTSNAMHGTANGSMTTGQRIEGQVDRALDFDGSNDYIGIPYSLNNHPPTVTVEAWVNFDVINTTYKSMVSTGAAGGWSLTHNDTQGGGSGTVSFKIGTLNGGASNVYFFATAPNSSFTAGTWYHLVGSWDGTNVRFYVNGSLISTSANATGNINYASSNSMIIGADADTGTVAEAGSYFDGKIDEVKVYSGAQTADWIKAEYRSQTDQLATYSPEETQGFRAAWCNDATGVTCNTDWYYRRRVEFINVPSTENLANFPVLIKLSDASVGSQLNNIDYTKTQSNGEDLRFVDPSNNAVAIPHEIETWNESGDSFVWVNVSQIDTAKNSDYIWMYYGNSTVGSPATQLGNATHATGVWDNDFKMVQHLEESASCGVTFSDSTTNNNTGSCTGTPTSTTGLIGNGRNFVAASSQSVDISPVALDVGSASFTYETWFKPAANFTSANTVDYNLFSFGETASGNDNDLYLDELDGTLTMCALDSSFADQCVGSSQASWTAGVWYHAVATLDTGAPGGMKLYVNGVLQADVNAINSRGTPASTVGWLGSWRATNSYFDGVLDDARISSSARSGEWVEASYAAGSNSMNTYGIEEPAPLSPPVLTALGVHESTAPTFQLRGADSDSPNWLRYKIEVCNNADCSSILQTIDQSVSQTGWSGQDANSTTAYVASATLSSSTLASYTWQHAALTPGQTYWWRGYSTDNIGATSDPSTISSFQVTIAPAAPTLVSPTSGETHVSLTPRFRLWTTDANLDNVKYQIDVCDTSTCTDDDGGGPHLGVLRAIDQRSSQTGWIGQNVETFQAYSTAAVLSGSMQAVHEYQVPALSGSTQYWWRAYAYDPTGSNLSSSASSIQSFTTRAVPENRVIIKGGTTIRGGTTVGP